MPIPLRQGSCQEGTGSRHQAFPLTLTRTIVFEWPSAAAAGHCLISVTKFSFRPTQGLQTFSSEGLWHNRI